MVQLNQWPWRHWATVRPLAAALRLGEQTINWQQLVADIDGVAAAFHQQGVTAGAGVVVRGKNSYRLLLAYLAGLQCAARVLPLNPQLPISLLKPLLPNLAIDFIFTDQNDDLSGLGLTTLVDSAAESIVPPPWDGQRLATMTLTSGSSGLPKAAVHRLDAHLSSAAGVLALMPFVVGDSWLLSLPLFHVSGQGIVWRWLSVGATLVIRDMQPLPQALEGCTHASLVPTQLWRLLAQPAGTSSLKAVLLGGAMIPTDLTEQAEARGIRCWCGYGLTEAASTVCAKRANGNAGVGVALAGRQVKLVDQEVWVKGDCLAAGYWQQGGLRPLTDENGWLHTRDRGQWLDDELHILGRLDNVFFSGGEGIQPEDIERILLLHPQVQHAFILPVDDAEFGQRPVAVIECSPELTWPVLSDWLTPQLAPFQRPVAFYRLPDELKKGGIKVSRRDVFDFLSNV
ncbi:o-succinylbenzoate--CoA ligase [Yersinia ruckeri]|uniref:o-succinylbenzoate--CoA ligase n=1 Tax=Yersinia ruckeri TaxID=29486 RepID=UPI0004E43C0F|nr:o-succinylbenzoate--CoA ligase [Yersinia ruckeri]ARZ00414.1 O-succinylbenzoic acid--CoA ligase [Yersinia ruckeri]EKN4197709.1 o-succinylbenzoate--CoA ligase [Yersinia ruckeri]EKN4203961.1 o-succinylbenzoate--CoA ligase [Yersinia ruckeri]EKN4687744.1 o-succinylbenzoate--CoA ligase [Yersinia ruckeri]EKN4701121.1 o-succinylbenzoate--CoA ligase [Yersinia ruckeri]